jgi:hypothetical protein
MAMLAEKFILVLETIRSRSDNDQSGRVVSNSPHVPIQLPLVAPSRSQERGN